MVAVLLEPGAPSWAQRFALRLASSFLPAVLLNPLRLPSFASTALPAAASWTGCIIYVSDKKKVGLSNGTGWTDPAGGVL